MRAIEYASSIVGVRRGGAPVEPADPCASKSRSLCVETWVTRMSNRTSLAPDENKSSSDWLAVAPSLEIRWLACVALVVPALLAAGVYWLHHVPAGTSARTPDTVMEVRLLAPQEHIEQRQESALQPNRTPVPQSDPSVESPEPPAAEGIAKPAPSKAVAAASPAAPSAPAFSAAPVRAPMNQKASMFQKALLTHIARYRRYPEEARRERLQGTVQVLFAMRRDGSVTDVWVRTSSGQRVLDAAAADTIRQAQPLPRIPPELPDHLTILVPVAFDMP